MSLSLLAMSVAILLFRRNENVAWNSWRGNDFDNDNFLDLSSGPRSENVYPCRDIDFIVVGMARKFRHT